MTDRARSVITLFRKPAEPSAAVARAIPIRTVSRKAIEELVAVLNASSGNAS